MSRDDAAQLDQYGNQIDTENPADPRPLTPAAGGYDYKKFQNAWYNAAPNTNLDDFIANHPDFATGASTSKRGEYLNLPGGESFDAYRDFGGDNAPTWGSQDYNYDTGDKYTPEQSAAAESAWASAHPSAGSGAGAGSGAATGGPAEAPAGDPYGAYSDQIHQQILGLLNKGNTPVTEQDVAAQYDPVNRVMQRNAQSSREQAAERLAAQGLNSGGSGGALDAEVNSINEQTGEQQGQVMGSLISGEVSARRQDVVNALQFAQGQEKTALQLELAQIDKQLRQQQIDTQNKSVGIQGQQVSNQNQQFYDNLSFDYANANNNQNDLLLSALLGN